MEKLKCPEIRFQQFKEAWSETTLGNLSQIRRGASPRPIEDPKWFDNDGVFGWLRIADVTQQNGRIFDIEQKLSVEGQKKTLILEEPHLILSIAATVGKPVINYVPTGIHDGFIVFLNLDADREFIFQWLERFRPNWFKLGQPGSQLNLNSELVKNQSIFLSPLMEEQTQIGHFFQGIDQSIALHEKKLTQTQNLKTVMLEKMFPKAGSKQPEIRLKGFCGDWEEKQLGDLATIRRGASPRPIEDGRWFDKNSNIGWLRIADVSEQNGRIFNIEQKLSVEGQQKTLVLERPHLILSIAATVGKPVINYVPTGIHDGFIVFLNLDTDLEFTFQWLERFRSEWFKLGQSGSQLNLNSDLVKNQKIFVPTVVEQSEIGQFFKQLDETLVLQQQQLQTLKNLKQAFLEKMFV